MCSASTPSSKSSLTSVALPRNLRARLAVLVFALLANAYAMANPFPYAPFLVVHLRMSDNVDSAGFWSGWIISSFMIGRLIASYPLGALSDTYGRRPVIELGLLSCIVFQLGFGLANDYFTACLMRFMMGATNGIIGVSKAWLPDLVPPQKQAFAMSMISGMWGVGSVLGPACGGLLSSRWPKERPFLLPNLVGAILALVALILTRLYLPAKPNVRWPTWCRSRTKRASRSTHSQTSTATVRAESSTMALVRQDGAQQVASASALDAPVASDASVVGSTSGMSAQAGHHCSQSDGTPVAIDVPHSGAELSRSHITKRCSACVARILGVPQTSFAPLLCLTTFEPQSLLR